MESFRGKFTEIKGPFSQRRYLPRLGKIRLGIKVQKLKNGKTIEYPKETSYFVVPPEIEAVYGPEPTVLDVLVPCEDKSIFFPQKYAWYGTSKGLKCHGNGEIAERFNQETKKWFEMKCPCEQLKTDQNPKGECTEQAHLMVILPKVNLGGTYQITTGSWNTVADLNSNIDYIRGMVGRVALIPLKLRRVAITTHHDGKPQQHYKVTLVLDADIEGYNKLIDRTRGIMETTRLQIEGPTEENPIQDPPDEVEDEAIDVTPQEEPGAGPVVTRETQTAPPPVSSPAPQPELAKQSKSPVSSPEPKPREIDAVYLSKVLDLSAMLQESEPGIKALTKLRKDFQCDGEGLPPVEQEERFLDELRKVAMIGA